MDVPTTFPIFPLEAVVLVPGGLLPLHVFEPRYRALVSDVLAGERAFAMAMPRAGHATDVEHEPPVHPVVGLGRILRHEPLPDGRSTVLLRGIARMRIEEELASGKPYRVVRAMPLPDLPVTADLVPRVLATAARLPSLDADRVAALARGDAAAAVDLLLMSARLPPRETHRLHSVPDVAARLAALERALDAREGRHRIEIEGDDPRLN